MAGKARSEMPPSLHGRHTDRRGQNNVIPITDWRKQTFIKWLLTPKKERNPPTQNALLEKFGIAEAGVLSRWKRDPEFQEEWERQYRATIGDPDKKSQIMATLLKTATDQDDPKHVQAAKAYFEIEGSLRPQKVEVDITRSVKDLTDDELDGELAARIAQQREMLRNQGNSA